MGRTGRRRSQRSKIATQSPAELFKFMRELGWKNETELAVQHFEATGRGLCSKSRTFAAGDLLIRLPLKCLVTVAMLEADDNFKRLFNAAKLNSDQRIPFQALMALYLLHQKHLGPESPLRAYLNTIPAHFSHPYFCPVAELQHLPESVFEVIVAQNRKIRDSFLHLQNVFANDVCECCGRKYFGEVYELSSFKWAYFVVNSRSVYINAKRVRPAECFFRDLLSDEGNLALAPLLDLFNHSNDVTTAAELVPDTRSQLHFLLTLQQCDAPLKPYSQLFINYGALPNLRLLLDYGFIVHDNRYDYFEFQPADIENLTKQYVGSTYHRNKFKFLREHNFYEQMFVHLHEGVSHNLHVVLHILFKQQGYFPNDLSQVAFGSASYLADVNEELSLLISLKIEEYKRLSASLAAVPALTDSGQMAIAYMQECVRYLQSYLEAHHCANG